MQRSQSGLVTQSRLSRWPGDARGHPGTAHPSTFRHQLSCQASITTPVANWPFKA